MLRNTHVYTNFIGYTLEACSCIYCLYYRGKREGCILDKCCCIEERLQASVNEHYNEKLRRIQNGSKN